MATEVDVISAAVVASAAAVRPKNPNKVRKRAPKACLSCRARKVRCDVSQRGRPCMNCYLDSETCVVTGRASRLRKTQRPGTAAPASAGAAAAGDGGAETTAAAPMAPSSPPNGTSDFPAPIPDSFVAGEEIDTNDHVADPGEHSHWHGQEHTHAAHAHTHDHSHDHGHGHNHGHSHGQSHAPPHSFTMLHHHSPAPDAASSRHRTASVQDSPQHRAASVHSSTDGLPHQQGGARYSQTPQPSQPSQSQPAQQAQHAQPAHVNGHPEAAPQPPPPQQQHQQYPNAYSNQARQPQPSFGNSNNGGGDFLGGAGGVGSRTGSSMPWSTTEQGLSMSADITYSYYPFLAINNLPGILPQDVNYLELQGCLRVPTRSILDEFVQQYFLHVHPLLPLFNEGDFWEVYCQQGAGSVAATGRMSLLVFQSMLFASCNFVSRNSICALGFPTIRAARATFYRRAKLLYDFETELSHAANAQAAVLLSFWSPIGNAGTKNPNTAWLCTAIHQARLAEAHHYAAMPTTTLPTAAAPNVATSATMSAAAASIPGAADPARRANVLKRLWWCCIIRDRVIGLGVRRSIQITRAHFDLEANAPLTRADLADEIERSRVYNPGTKSCLIEILVHLVELCVVLTDILMLVFPQDDTPGWGRQSPSDDAGRVRQCKIELRRWYKDVALKFPMFGGGRPGPTGSSSSSHGSSPGTGSPAVGGGGGGGVARVNGGREFFHDSVILYTNLMYMYYHSSRVALCHHEVLQIAVINAAGASSVPIIYENRHELQDAASGVTECLKELIQLRLARWLPISAVACTALPLFLHILDVKLSQPPKNSNAAAGGDPAAGSPSPANGSASSALKQHRLNILIEAMKTYQPQYDGVDWVSELIRHSVNLTQLDGSTARAGGDDHGTANGQGGGNSNGNGRISDWTDILATNPSLYLRLALTVDLALSKSRLPEERDFPVGLRGLFSNGFSPARQLSYNKAGGGGDANGMGTNGAAHCSSSNNNNSNNNNNNNRHGLVNSNFGNGMAAPGQASVPGYSTQANGYGQQDGNSAAATATMPTMASGSGMLGAHGPSLHQANGASAMGDAGLSASGASMPATATTAGGALPPDIVGYSPEYAATAATALAGGAPFMLAPHHLAMSMSVVMGMGMGMGMDMDPGMDLVDMDVDMSMAFPLSAGPSAAPTPGSGPGPASSAATAGAASMMPLPGTVTQLPSSDEETTSPGTDSVSPASLSVVSGPSDAGNSPAATAAPPTGNDKGKNVGHSAAIREGDDWMQQGWADEELREGDRDTARALLEAMGEAA